MTTQKIVNIIAVIFITSIIAACVTQPPRAPYTGSDTVGAISKNMLIGHWKIRILNPIEGEQLDSADIHYRDDGTLLLNSQSSSSGMDMALEISGTWSIQGDLVNQKMESIRETSDNKIAAMMIPLMNSMKSRMSGSANVYSASADRVVLVSSTGGQAQELTRIR